MPTSVALYGVETWTLRKEDEKRIEAFEMWMWRRMEGVKWEDRVRNKEVLRRVGEKREILKTIRKRKNWTGRCLRRDSIIKDSLEGMVSGKRRRGRNRRQSMDNIKIENYHYHQKAGRRQRTVEEFVKETCCTAGEPMMMMTILPTLTQ